MHAAQAPSRIGGGGSGKSLLINKVLTPLFHAFYGVHGLMKEAASNRASRNIGGVTLHAANSLTAVSAYTDCDPVRLLAPRISYSTFVIGNDNVYRPLPIPTIDQSAVSAVIPLSLDIVPQMLT